MYDEPSNILMPSQREYGSLDGLSERLQQCCQECCQGEDVTIAALRQMSDFFSKKANDLRDIADNDVTMEDFERIKKQDLDGDGEAGEEKGFK